MVNVVGIHEPDGKTSGDGNYKKKVDKHYQIVNHNINYIVAKENFEVKVEDVYKQKKKEVFTFLLNVADDIHKEQENEKIDVVPDEVMVKVVGKAVNIYGTDEGNH